MHITRYDKIYLYLAWVLDSFFLLTRGLLSRTIYSVGETEGVCGTPRELDYPLNHAAVYLVSEVKQRGRQEQMCTWRNPRYASVALTVLSALPHD